MLFYKSFFNYDKLPHDNINEICFLGRSNVGKSSLINMIANSKVAKTSKTPGATRLINFFNYHKKLRIVDLPGYGYSKAPDSITKKWNSLLIKYITERPNLKNRFILIDSKVGFKKNDLDVLELLKKYKYEILFTKSEKISELQKKSLLEFAKINNIIINENFFLSSKTGKGKKNILQFINQHIQI